MELCLRSTYNREIELLVSVEVYIFSYCITVISSAALTH